MLIGGPNQSHKVSFKELLPFQGKDVHQAKNIAEGQYLFRKIFRSREDFLGEGLVEKNVPPGADGETNDQREGGDCAYPPNHQDFFSKKAKIA
jgi:hypothetical protein